MTQRWKIIINLFTLFPYIYDAGEEKEAEFIIAMAALSSMAREWKMKNPEE